MWSQGGLPLGHTRKPPITSIRAFTFYVGVIIIFLFLKIEINEKLMFEYKLKIYFDSIFL